MWRRWWLNLERSLVYQAIRLTRLRHESERVARGFAVGLMVHFFPTFGVGVVISGVLARLVGGNVVAGVVGGGLLAFAWPLLFLLNLWTGSFFFPPSRPLPDLEVVATQSQRMLSWGKTFAVGALLNSLVIGGVVYLLLRALYAETRPAALAYFRRHAREHQRRFRKPRAGP